MKYLFLLASVTCIATPALAQEAEPEEGLEPIILQHPIRDSLITVVATGQRGRVDRSGQSISVVGQDEIADIQGPDLTRVLTRLPGVTFSRNGGLGAQTGLNVRGANADQLLTVIDGVRIADYASPGGGYDLGNLLADNLSKVELLRGSNSVAWGSQAIGGVLAVTTEELDGARASGEYGAYDTAVVTGAAGLSREGYAASLTGGYARTDGFSAQSGGTEKDGYRQWNVAGKARLALGDTLTWRNVARYADSKLDIDSFGPDDLDTQHTRELTARSGLDYAGQALRLGAGVAYSDIRRDYTSAFGPYYFKGHAWRGEVTGQADLADSVRLDFGADSEWSRTASEFDAAAKARLSSGHALLTYTTGLFNLTGGARLDDHSRFGSHWTFGANASFTLGEDWRLRGSYGEGFKAPTLYQLYGSFVGNPALQPETSRSFDVGIEKGDRNGWLHFSATVFRRDSRNLIDLDEDFVYQNVARARATGAELELGARISEALRARAAYTWLKARDRTNDRDLARRPRHAVAVGIDWTTPLAGLELGGDIRLQGDSVEYDFSGTPIALDGFAVATLRASLPVGDHVELYGRVENLTDQHYETAAGFNTPGRSAYGGVRLKW